MIDICANCGTQVGVMHSELKHLATKTVWCEDFGDSRVLTHAVLKRVNNVQDAIEYRQVLLHGVSEIPVPGVSDIKEQIKSTMTEAIRLVLLNQYEFGPQKQAEEVVKLLIRTGHVDA